MEQHSLKIEDLSSNEIESEVPRQQKIREANTTSEQAGVEPAQLQNVHTIEWEDLRDMVKKPVYVGIQERVIRSPQRIRTPRVRDGPQTEEDKTKEEKPQTRIPVSRFRPAVERVQKERRAAREEEEKRKKEAPGKPRRSSIPKLKERVSVARNKSTTGDVKTENEVSKEAKDESSKAKERKPVRREKIPVTRHYKVTKKVGNALKSDNNDTNTDTLEDQTPEPIQNEELEDEFDKLYEEIVDTDAGSLPDEILDTKVKDPEKLESKFEEIVHQYDEESIEQVKIEPVDKARYSKIPLLRRRSSHDVKAPKQYERRLSLKTGITNNSLKVGDDKTNISKVDIKNDSNSIHGVNKDNIEEPEENDQDNSIEINNNEDQYLRRDSPDPIPIYNTIATPESELVKVGIFGMTTREIPLENNEIQTINVETPDLETVKIATINSTMNDPSRDRNDDETMVEETPVYNTNPKSTNQAESSTSNTIAPDTPELDNVISIETRDIEKQIIREENVISSTAGEKETIKTATIQYDTVLQSEVSDINVKQIDILVNNPEEELKSFSLIKNTNNVEERSQSRYIMKAVDQEIANDVNTATLDEEIPIVKGKVKRILRRLTSHEQPTNGDADIDIKKEETDIKTQVQSIPKKSVLSKIAMFERAEQEPPIPKKQPHRYSKPKRTISEETKHSPKIVHEVLKPNSTETTDKYTVVNIDIHKPVEVITNNEEQVVVENLTAETIVFDNFDEAKVDKIESIETKASETRFNDTKEIIVVNNNRDRDSVAKALEIDEEEYINSEKSTENNIQTDNETHNGVTEVTENIPKNQIPREENYEPTQFKPGINKTRLYNKIDKVEKWKSTEALANFVPVKDKINRLKSYDENNMTKVKSAAELDIGQVVKGKVKNMIVRMNSFDLLEDVKQKDVEVIDVKERPRKRSVSEKIALFERKLTPVAMESVKIDSGRALNLDGKPVKDTVNSIPVNVTAKPVRDTIPDVSVTDEQYAAKIKELTDAKLKYGSVANMSYMELRDGRKMPVLALGTALLDPRLTKHIIAAAIDLGFRAIDTAFIYGNEKEVGEGIRAKIKDGTVKREDLFIMSKLWSTFHRPDLVAEACRASLAATGLDYFDLYMIHNPMAFKEGGDPLPKIANVIQYSSVDYLDTWYAVEDLVALGLVKSIGVSNFNSVQVGRLVEKGRVKPAVNQVECHPYLTQERLSEYCDTRDVRLSCFGVLGSKGTPAELKSTQAAAIDDPLVQVMAAGLEITAAQLLIRYQIERGHNVVVKASSAAHLRDDLQALRASLQPTQVAALNALNKNKRAFTFKGMGDTHRNYPFKIPF